MDLISDYVGPFLMFLSSVIFVRFILNKKCKINWFLSLLIVIVVSAIDASFYSLEFVLLRPVVSLLGYSLMYKIIFGVTDSENIMINIAFYSLILASEIILFVLTTTLLKLSGNVVYAHIGGTVFANFFVGMFCLVLGLCLKNAINKLIRRPVRNKIVIYWVMSLGCLTLFLLTILSDANLNIETFWVLSLLALALFVIFVSFYQANKNNELAVKYDKLLDFIKKYETEIDKQRTLRHETKNQLLTIKSKLIDKDKTDNVIKYIDEIINDNDMVICHSEYSRLKYLPSNGIKGLFYFKVSEANDRKISVNINISKEIKNSYISKLSPITFNQLGKILGVFLDNAIEGVELASEKQIGIEMYCNSDEEIIVIISNTYGPVKPKKAGVTVMSTKGNDRGHGLLLVRTIIASNKMFENETEITNDLYIQKLIIKKQEDK